MPHCLGHQQAIETRYLANLLTGSALKASKAGLPHLVSRSRVSYAAEPDAMHDISDGSWDAVAKAENDD